MDSIEIMKSEVQSPTEDNQNDKSKFKKMHSKRGIGNLYAGMKERCCEFLEGTKVYEKLAQMLAYMEANPFFTFCLFAILAAVATPIVLFVLFAIVNVAFIVAGFIIVEVTIFIIGATVLSSSVFFVITAVAVIGLFLLSFYLIFCYVVILLKKLRT
ncbi:uncharacterized protein LOC117177766 [Belonocnema kinseyi]|uniref:uncharacterized protein LOC117177766 n=1 Tax=Belonocnema kinseyi TaxID=2817044 RepID=UPI00143D348D|nr:uncharacterized protein LOC117177766 [Belonocnema kinseyi]